MHIKCLKVYCDLVDSQSFTKAAAINGITQSAVSQQVATLERNFQSLLIERSKILFRLTREGRVVYDYARQITAHYRSFEHRLMDLKGSVSSTIELAAIYSIGLHVLPLYLKRFMRNCPAVQIRVNYRSAGQVNEEVLDNVADLGLVAYPVKSGELEVVPLHTEPLVLVCSPRHPFAQKKSVGLETLNGQKFISFDPDTPTRRALDRELRGRGVQVEHAMEFDNVETVKRAVEIDCGVSIVPESTVALELEKRTLARVEIKDCQFFRPTAVIHKKSRALSPAIRQFIAILKEGV